jgi:leucyl/phenylalanyl-tRNA--protein transferase
MLRARLDPETLLNAYSQGAFPMADRNGSVRWYTADPRGIIPLESFHVSKTLAQKIRNTAGIDIRINHDFRAIMRACQEGRPDGTWINDDLIAGYVRLHDLGYAHSVETWWDGELAGGLYGVSLGGAFFGESMFHRRTDASKIALVALVDRLKARKFTLLDAQASTKHLKKFGCVDIPAVDYQRRLAAALHQRVTFV